MDSRDAPQLCIGIDGYQRSTEAETKLNSMFAGVFTRGAGAQILDYLRGISMQAVVPPSESSDRLRHQEGMRDLYRIIQERTNKGKVGQDDRSSGSGGGGQGGTIITRRRGQRPRREGQQGQGEGADNAKR